MSTTIKPLPSDTSTDQPAVASILATLATVRAAPGTKTIRGMNVDTLVRDLRHRGFGGVRPETVAARLDEAAGLAGAIGLDVVERLHFKVRQPSPRTLFGRGQVIWRLPGGGYVAGSDKRADGAAVGF